MTLASWQKIETEAARIRTTELRTLAALLEMPEAELRKKLDSDRTFVYLKRQVEMDVIAKIDAQVRQVIDAATEACKAAGPPPADILCTDVYADGGWAWRN